MKETLKKIKWKHYANYIVIAILTLVFSLLSLSGSLSISTLYLLEKIAIAVLLTVSLSVVVGFLGGTIVRTRRIYVRRSLLRR